MRRRSGGPNGGGICIPTDLVTYSNFVKYWINVNDVSYSLHSLCGDKLGIKSPPSSQMDAACHHRYNMTAAVVQYDGGGGIIWRRWRQRYLAADSRGTIWRQWCYLVVEWQWCYLAAEQWWYDMTVMVVSSSRVAVLMAVVSFSSGEFYPPMNSC